MDFGTVVLFEFTGVNVGVAVYEKKETDLFSSGTDYRHGSWVTCRDLLRMVVSVHLSMHPVKVSFYPNTSCGESIQVVVLIVITAK